MPNADAQSKRSLSWMIFPFNQKKKKKKKEEDIKEDKKLARVSLDAN